MSSEKAQTFISSIPENLQKDLIYYCHVYLSRNVHHDIVITQGPILYEIRRKHILSSCDLSKSLLAGNFVNNKINAIRECKILTNSSAIPHLGQYPIITSDSAYRNSNIQFEVKFSYSKNVKKIFYFLKINRDFAIIGKCDNELMVSVTLRIRVIIWAIKFNIMMGSLQVLREFSNVEDYETFDENNTGEMSLRMQTSSFNDVANIQLNALLLKDISQGSNSDKLAIFEGIHKAVTNRLSEIRSHLTDAKILLQQSHSQLAQKLQFSSNNVSEQSSAGLFQNRTHSWMDENFEMFQTEEECLILAKYGDIWMRNVNGKIVIGIPIYNCSFERWAKFAYELKQSSFI